MNRHNRRQFIGHTVAVMFVWTGTAFGMTALQKMIVLAPPSLSPVAAAIVAELRRQGFTASDDLKRWIVSAVTATGSKHFQIVVQPQDSLSITLSVTGNGQLRTWWGDGRFDRYQLTDTAQVITHAYQAAARRPVVLIGNFALVE